MPLLVSQTYAHIVLQPLVEGTLIVEEFEMGDGREYILVEAQDKKPFKVMGYVDLCNLATGDRVLLREYITIKEGGEYRLYDKAPYEDEQEKPLIYVESKESSHGIKVTIQQEAGEAMEIDYQFFKTKV